MQRLPTQPCSLSTAIADKLRARILQREWQPDTDLNEGAIAAAYGFSRTPLREAMKLLAQEGLLQALPRRGMRIATLTPQLMNMVIGGPPSSAPMSWQIWATVWCCMPMQRCKGP